jgi:hypothetical protein
MALDKTSLLESDLQSQISAAELDGLAKSLLAVGQENPILWAIEKQFDLLGSYVDLTTVKTQYEDTVLDYWAKMAVFAIYNRLGRVPAKRREEREEALQWLRDVRDGKFPHIFIDEDSDFGAASTGAFTSGTSQSFSMPGSKRDA